MSELGPKCGSIHQAKPTPPRIEPMLKKLEAIAGGPKTSLALSNPITKADRDTNKINGNIICVSRTVSAAFSSAKPPARTSTKEGASSTPMSTTKLSTTVANVAILLASAHAEASSPVVVFLEKTVTNAVDNAPSAKRSRNRFGMRNATLNASMAMPAPKSAARICSLASPSNRLHITATPTIPAARVLSSGLGFAFAGEDEVVGRSLIGFSQLHILKGFRTGSTRGGFP